MNWGMKKGQSSYRMNRHFSCTSIILVACVLFSLPTCDFLEEMGPSVSPSFFFRSFWFMCYVCSGYFFVIPFFSCVFCCCRRYTYISISMCVYVVVSVFVFWYVNEYKCVQSLASAVNVCFWKIVRTIFFMREKRQKQFVRIWHGDISIYVLCIYIYIYLLGEKRGEISII